MSSQGLLTFPGGWEPACFSSASANETGGGWVVWVGGLTCCYGFL